MIKNIIKNLSGKYNQKTFDHAKQSATDALKTASKTAEATDDLIGNKIAGKITEISETLPYNNSQTGESKIKMPKEEYVPPEKNPSKLLMI